MRPGEVFSLRRENIILGENGGLIHVLEGKTKAAQRSVPRKRLVTEGDHHENEEQNEEEEQPVK